MRDDSLIEEDERILRIEFLGLIKRCQRLVILSELTLRDGEPEPSLGTSRMTECQILKERFGFTVLFQTQQRLSQVFDRFRVIRYGLACLLEEVGGFVVVSPTKLHDPFRNAEIIGLIRHLCPCDMMGHEPNGAHTEHAVPFVKSVSLRHGDWLGYRAGRTSTNILSFQAE